MTVRERLTAAALAALGGVDGLAVFDAPPARATLPYAVLEEPDLRPWEAADLRAVEGKLAVTLHDAGERPVRLRLLGQAAEDALGGIAGEIGGGWRVTQCRLVRSRLVRAGGADRWRWTGEFAVRVFRTDG